MQAQRRGSAKFAQASLDYVGSSINPIESGESNVEQKVSKTRAIQRTKAETSVSTKRTKSSEEQPKSNIPDKVRIRNFDRNEVSRSTEGPRPSSTRTFRKKSATTATPSTTLRTISEPPKVNRKQNFPSRNAITTPKPLISTTSRLRKGFPSQSPTPTSSTVASLTSFTATTTRAPKKFTFSRGAAKLQTTRSSKSLSLEELEDENYPEHFKAILKAKYKDNKIEPAKGYSKAPKLDITTKAPQKDPKANVLFSTRSRSLPRFKSSSTTELPPIVSSTIKSNLKRPRPTEASKVQLKNQSPPLRPTRTTTKLPLANNSGNNKVLSPPIKEYFPPTSAVSTSTMLQQFIHRVNRFIRKVLQS